MDGSIPKPAGQSARQFQEIIEPLKPAFVGLEEFLAGQITEFEPVVQPLARYCFGHSGKKLRPILVFSMALSGKEGFSEPVIKAAAIVELVHLATLVHDDILDEADMRHRTETVVAKYGSHVAVLLGDALFAHSLHLASQYPDVEVCRMVSKATRQVCSGEIAQTFARGGEVPTTAAYFRMIDLKTAELFSVSAYLGGYLSGFSPDQLKAASAFARHLGIAYQIYDDAADIFGKEANAGKTLGTDLATGKFTLPILIWLEGLSPSERDLALVKLRDPKTDPIECQKELTNLGILELVKIEFFKQIDLARDALRVIPDEQRQRQLGKLADFVQSAWNKFSIR